MEESYYCDMCGKELQVKDAYSFECRVNDVLEQYTLCEHHAGMLHEQYMKLNKKLATR